MQLVYAGQENVVNLPVVTKTGDAITSGTVRFYLRRQSDSTWYNGATGTWTTSETIAGYPTHVGRGQWELRLGSSVWTKDAEYLLSVDVDGTDCLPISDEIRCVGRSLSDSITSTPGTSMTISDILDFIQKAFGDTNGSITETDITEPLKFTLKDLSDKDLLIAETTLSVSSGDEYVDLPTGYRSLVYASIGDYGPLEPMSGGRREMEYARQYSNASGRPTYYAIANNKMELYPKADTDYTIDVMYFKNHPDSTTIEFGSEYDGVIKVGVCYWFATMRRNEKYIKIWGPNYARLLDEAVKTRTQVARIVR